MGQKVHPTGFRLGYIRSWDSKWFREAGYANWLLEDMKLREYVRRKLKSAGISRIDIERAADKCKVNIYTARPGIVIGKNKTTAAGTNLLLDPEDGLGKVSCLLRCIPKHPESKTLCGLTSHAGET